MDSVFCQINVIGWTLAYGLVSGTLLVVNKWTLLYFPVFLMLASQMGVSAFVMYMSFKYRGQSVTLTSEKFRKFLPVVFLFFFTLVTSSYTLQFLTVDIFVALRCCSTFTVALGEFLVGGRKLPSLISSISLLSLALSSIFVFAIGAADYFSLKSTIMAIFYVLALSIDQVVNRMFVVELQISTDERVLWMNSISFVGCLFCYFVSFIFGRLSNFDNDQVQFEIWSILPLTISCFLGIAI